VIFTAKVSKQNDALNYDFSLEGKFVFKGGTLTFQIMFSNAETSPSIQNAGISGQPGQPDKRLSLALNVSEGQSSIDFQFEMKLTFIYGVLMKSSPQTIAA
jgi:hypothetical protein